MVSWRPLLPQKRYFELFWGFEGWPWCKNLRTFSLFRAFCFSRGSIEFTSLSYITREFNRFLHQGWADFFSVKRRSKGRTQNFFKIVQNTTFEAKGRQFRVIHCLWLIHSHIYRYIDTDSLSNANNAFSWQIDYELQTRYGLKRCQEL